MAIFKIFQKSEKAEQLEKNFKDYLEAEESEISDYVCNKEGLGAFFSHSESLFAEYFIPCRKNGHRPKMLRARSLALIVVIMALLKLSVALYIFYFTSYQAKMSEDFSAQILALVNRDRTAQGLEPFAINPVLSASALRKAENMLANNYFAHFSPDGKKPWDFIDRNSYPYLYVGENLAMNFTSAESAHQALMLSPSHKENIMSKRYHDAGLAVVSGKIAGKETNVLVQLFALRKESQVNLALAQDKSAGSTADAVLPAKIVSPATVIKSAPISPPIPAKKIAALPVKPVEKKGASKAVLPAKNEMSEITASLPAVPGFPAEEIAPSSVQEPSNSDSVPAVSYVRADSEPDVLRGSASPNEALENGLVTQVKSFDNIPEEDMIDGDHRLIAANNLTLAVLGVLFVFLLVNILIKAEIQHRPVIFQTLLAIVCLAVIIYLRFDFLESALPKLFVV